MGEIFRLGGGRRGDTCGAPLIAHRTMDEPWSQSLAPGKRMVPSNEPEVRNVMRLPGAQR